VAFPPFHCLIPTNYESIVNVTGCVQDFAFDVNIDKGKVDLQHLDAIIAVTANSSWWNAILVVLKPGLRSTLFSSFWFTKK
jgi:hypothetical protein